VSDPQDQAEALDDDKLDDDTGIGDAELGTDYPPDRPQGVDRMAITPAEEAFPESVVERARREQPDLLAEELDRDADEAEAREMAAANGSDDDVELTDIDPEGAGWRDDDLNRPIELVSPTGLEQEDDEADLVAEAVPAVDLLPAEEDAVHPTGEAPYRSEDSYLESSDEG
jgi:hypothetical protein